MKNSNETTNSAREHRLFQVIFIAVLLILSLAACAKPASENAKNADTQNSSNAEQTDTHLANGILYKRELKDILNKYFSADGGIISVNFDGESYHVTGTTGKEASEVTLSKNGLQLEKQEKVDVKCGTTINLDHIVDISGIKATSTDFKEWSLTDKDGTLLYELDNQTKYNAESGKEVK